jgi:hypothetical protein
MPSHVLTHSRSTIQCAYLILDHRRDEGLAITLSEVRDSCQHAPQFSAVLHYILQLAGHRRLG